MKRNCRAPTFLSFHSFLMGHGKPCDDECLKSQFLYLSSRDYHVDQYLSSFIKFNCFAFPYWILFSYPSLNFFTGNFVNSSFRKSHFKELVICCIRQLSSSQLHTDFIKKYSVPSCEEYACYIPVCVEVLHF